MNIDSAGIKVSDSPSIWLVRAFATPETANHLITIARDKLDRAVVSGDDGGVVSAGRSGSNCWIPHGHDAIVNNLVTRIAGLVAIPLAQAESLQVIHYGPGEEYAPHYDAWDVTSPRGQRCMRRGGQRRVTCLLYLNTVSRGGQTGFPKLSVELEAVAGDLVVFLNTQKDSNQRHPDSLHGGMPVIEGEKWACNLWFREQVYQR